MDVHDGFIPQAEFSTCLDVLPQVCVEVVLERDGEVLVAKRTNEPAAANGSGRAAGFTKANHSTRPPIELPGRNWASKSI